MPNKAGGKSTAGTAKKPKSKSKGPVFDEDIAFRQKQAADKKALKAAAAAMTKGKKKR